MQDFDSMIALSQKPSTKRNTSGEEEQLNTLIQKFQDDKKYKVYCCSQQNIRLLIHLAPIYYFQWCVWNVAWQYIKINFIYSIGCTPAAAMQHFEELRVVDDLLRSFT